MAHLRGKFILDAIHRLGGSWNMSKTGLTVKAWWVAFDLKVVPCRYSRISAFRFYTFVISVLHYLKHDVSLTHETPMPADFVHVKPDNARRKQVLCDRRQVDSIYVESLPRENCREPTFCRLHDTSQGTANDFHTTCKQHVWNTRVRITFSPLPSLIFQVDGLNRQPTADNLHQNSSR